MRAYYRLPAVAVIAAASLIAGSPVVSPVPGVQTRAVWLTGDGTATSPLGDGTALVMGGTGIPQPGQRYLDAVDALYLQPQGFGGNLQSLFTPENASSTSHEQGEQILYDAIMKQINGGDVDADNPVVVFGYSQSASISSEVMSRLAEQGVPSDYVHFTLIGAPDASSVPSDLYPTDIYIHEYDPVAYSPTYFNPLAELNSTLGFVYEHTTYLSLTPEQIASAIELPTSDPDALTNYFMIPAESLPLLDPLRLIPVIGQPLYDLLEPDTRILVNLGYGSIDQGWSPGFADAPAESGLFPTHLDWDAVAAALGSGLQQGISDAIATLQDPDTYQITPLVDNPSLTDIIEMGYVAGFLDTPHPTLMVALQGLGDFLQAFTAT